MKKKSGLLPVFLLSYFFSYSQPCSVPDSFFSDDTMVVCQGSSVQLTGPVVAGGMYTWSTADGGPSITVGYNGKYWLQVSDGVCTKVDSITILFNSFLLSPQVNDLKLCKGSPARPIQAEGQNLLWYGNPVGGTGSAISPMTSAADTGSVTHWISQTIKGCETPRVPLLVKVIDKPDFELGNAFIIPCGALGIVLQVIPDGESNYTWSNGTSQESMMAVSRGKYWLYAENMCGNHSDSVVAVECEDKCVQLPTAFTPNSDGKNDIYQAACFCPVPEYKLVIFNRNGEKVFQTSDPKAGWNGNYKGQHQPNGVYIYYTEFFDFVMKQSFTQKGTLVLIR